MVLVHLTEALFWASVAVLTYTYVGYLLLLLFLNAVRPDPVRRGSHSPPVTVIIAAYNEEKALRAKLENTVQLNYPKHLLEIIVASDCSTDGTDDIVRSFAADGVVLCRQRQRLGKTAAQNAAVERARGQIVLFSDATTVYEPDVLTRMIPYFADPLVGCVTGRVEYRDPAVSAVGHGTRSYWDYEFKLKTYESSVRSLIGVCGCMYAVRKSAYVPLYHEACSDFLIATTTVKQGLRAVYEPDAVCFENTNDRSNQEFKVRVRIIAQTLSDLWRNREMLNPFRQGFYSIELLSHKLLRYFAPVLLLVVLLSSAFLARVHWFYLLCFVVQALFYGVAFTGWLVERIGITNRWIAMPQYFVIANLASLVAVVQFFRGERYARWEPLRENLQSPAVEIINQGSHV
ncbi:MAG: glycosyltransferase family 2 protein [Pyrinomonadaceae bacterium]